MKRETERERERVCVRACMPRCGEKGRNEIKNALDTKQEIIVKIQIYKVIYHMKVILQNLGVLRHCKLK